MALGARSGDLVRLVVAQVLVVAAAGGVLGVVLAINGMTVISRLLFGVSPADPLTLAAAFFALIAAAAAAALGPAQRTARLSMMDALRHD